MEPSLRAAGNLYTIIAFAVMPLFWSLPEALITYELSSEYPCDSGCVRFVSGWDRVVFRRSLSIIEIAHFLHVLLMKFT